MSIDSDRDADDDTDESGDWGESASTDCPHCGRPIMMVTITGPTTARASPCGCRVAPEVLE